jgi:pimeloyl-ACP methyl ester carboxylesterase
VNEFHVLPDMSDENSIVFSNEKHLGVPTRIVISFRGTVAKRLDDLLTDVFVTFGKEDTTERFRMAVEKMEYVTNMYPEVPIVLCGHSLGGSQAIYVAKKYNTQAYCYNPAQGISATYLEDINKYKKIRVLRVLNDPISCIAGLENIGGIVLFPRVSRLIPYKNHSLTNFLPPEKLPKEVDI